MSFDIVFAYQMIFPNVIANVLDIKKWKLKLQRNDVFTSCFSRTPMYTIPASQLMSVILHKDTAHDDHSPQISIRLFMYVYLRIMFDGLFLTFYSHTLKFFSITFNIVYISPWHARYFIDDCGEKHNSLKIF